MHRFSQFVEILVWKRDRLFLFGGVFFCFIGLAGCDQRPASPVMEKKSEIKIPSSSENPSVSSKGNQNQAYQEESLRIGIVDFNVVWHTAKAAVKIRDDIQTKRRAYQKEIIHWEEKLRHEDEALQAQHEKISAEVYKAKRKQFESDVLDVQKKVQDRKKRLEQAYASSMEKVTHHLNAIIKKVAHERHFNLILSEAQVAFRAKEIDITDRVLEELDATLPSVELEE